MVKLPALGWTNSQGGAAPRQTCWAAPPLLHTVASGWRRPAAPRQPSGGAGSEHGWGWFLQDMHPQMD